MRIFDIDRKVANEAHSFNEFIRFTDSPEHILVSRISPKSNVLTLVAPHFADRMPSENWMIIDDTRYIAIVHPADQDYYLTSHSPEETERLTREYNDPYVSLCKGFFTHIGIKKRENPRCQRNMLPLWYRRHMTEFKNTD